MSEIKNGGNESAFPYDVGRGPGGFAECSFGLTKRELIAAMAMQGMITGLTKFHPEHEGIIQNRPSDVAEISCVYADALLKELGGSDE